jgi:hypothetical protein
MFRSNEVVAPSNTFSVAKGTEILLETVLFRLFGIAFSLIRAEGKEQGCKITEDTKSEHRQYNVELQITTTL